MTESSGSQEITALLVRWRQGDAGARDDLIALVYPELQRRARGYLRSERPNHTLDAGAVVHEAFVRLVGAEIDWQDRAHFFAVAARIMRRVLVDYGRRRRREKRGGGAVQVTLAEGLMRGDEPGADVVALNDALDRLAAVDARKAQIVELHFFGGLTYEETAEVLGTSRATVTRELRFAKAWLHDQLAQPPEDG